MTEIAEARRSALEAEPMRLVGARPGFVTGTVSSLRDIAGQRQLLVRLVARELKARYKDSTLGFVWSLIRPLAMLAIYYVAIGKFLGAARSVPQFAIFVYTGLTAWTLYADIVQQGTSSVVMNAGLVKKVYLPREVFPLASVGSAVFNFAIQLAILVLATVALGQFPTGSRWWYFPLSLAVLLVLGTALALLLSAVNVYLRDVQYLVEVVWMILFWASPVVYSLAQVQGQIGGTWLEDVYLANPMTLVILGFQETFWVAGDAQPAIPNLAGLLGIWLAVALVLLWVCQRIFSRLQSNFAQEL